MYAFITATAQSNCVPHPAGTGDAYRTGGRDSQDNYNFAPYRRVLLDVFPRGPEDAELHENDEIPPEGFIISHVPDAILAAVELIVSMLQTALSLNQAE